MKAENLKKFGYGLGCLLAILIWVVTIAISWIATCCVVWLVALCFGFEFSWLVATGVWIIACFIGGLFSGKK